MTTLRDEAVAVAHEVAARLSDVAAVTERCSANIDVVGGHPFHPWQPASLAEGNAGIAVLFAELSAHDAGWRPVTHAHLAAAAGGLAEVAHHGLYTGAPAVAFAADCANRASGDYSGLLGKLDLQVATLAAAIAEAETDRMDAGLPGRDTAAFDLISGLVGVARLLLDRDGETAVVHDLLACLIRLTEPLRVRGADVPGWWVEGAPSTSSPAEGHFNLGLAHGAAGFLPVLTHAQHLGLPDADKAIDRVQSWLVRWRTTDPVAGVRWPHHVSFEQETGSARRPQPGRNAWCYGTAGTAHCLWTSATALGDDEVLALAEESMLSMPSTHEYRHMTDVSLCHGLAGLLTVTQTMVENGCTTLTDQLDALARRVIDDFDATTPFGFTYRSGPGTEFAPHRSGFLEGAAGIALALLRYARGSTATSWPRSMLLA